MQERKQVLGSMGVILLPSLKLKEQSADGLTYEQEVHDFLIANFKGYTVASGNISGYWQDSKGNQLYGEHREYKVALPDEKAALALEQFVSDLAPRIGESCIFMERANEACLIYGVCKEQR